MATDCKGRNFHTILILLGQKLKQMLTEFKQAGTRVTDLDSEIITEWLDNLWRKVVASCKYPEKNG